MATRSERIDRAMYLARVMQTAGEAHAANVAGHLDPSPTPLTETAAAWVAAEQALRTYLTTVIA